MSRAWQDAEVSVYDRLVWPDGVVEQMLVSGARRRELIAYLGEEEYMQLLPLAVRARQARRDPDDVVYLVPGIMGSQLGVPRPAPLPANLLWIDPTDIQAGALPGLQLQSQSAAATIQPLGVVLYTYLRLKLHLAAAGFTVRCFDYDWRRSVREPAALLAARLAAETAQRCSVIGHSMGGLVARAALAVLDQRASLPTRDIRVIALAAPQRGSFAPVQGLRATYATVRRIAQLDPGHTAEFLVENTFSSFPSLYEMLPASAPDLFDPASWPARGLRPDAALLHAAQDVSRSFAAADRRIYALAGVGYNTVTSLGVADDEFLYRFTRNGDGTVPAQFATLPGMPTWYATVAHSELPRDAQVAAALIELLRDGRTQRLPSAYDHDDTTTATVSDARLRSLHTAKLDWAGMTPEARRQFLDSLNEPPAFIAR